MTDDRDLLRQYDKDSAGQRVLVGLSAKETRVWDFLSDKDLAGQLIVEEQRLYEFLLAKHDRARADRWDIEAARVALRQHPRDQREAIIAEVEATWEAEEA